MFKELYIKLYLPNGAEVSYPMSFETITEAFVGANSMVGALQAAGFLLESPKQSGEVAELVGSVLRQAKDDGTPFIQLYLANEKTTHAFVKVYLDTPEDIAAFEAASGLVFKTLPVYEGERLERNGSEKAQRYIVTPRKQFKALIVPNPLFNPDELDIKKRKPKYKFVRFEAVAAVGNTTPATTTPPPAANGATSQPDAENGQAPGKSFKAIYKNFMVNLTQKNAPVLVFTAPNVSPVHVYSGQKFRDAGYNTDEWKTVGYHELPAPAELTMSADNRGYLQVNSVRMLDVFEEAS